MIYRGEDSIVRHWLKGTVEYGRLAAGCRTYAGEAGGAPHCSTSPALPGRQKRRKA